MVTGDTFIGTPPFFLAEDVVDEETAMGVR